MRDGNQRKARFHGIKHLSKNGSTSRAKPRIFMLMLPSLCINHCLSSTGKKIDYKDFGHHQSVEIPDLFHSQKLFFQFSVPVIFFFSPFPCKLGYSLVGTTLSFCASGVDEEWGNNFSEKDACTLSKIKTGKSNRWNCDQRSKIDLDTSQILDVQNYRIFVATWNVAWKSPPGCSSMKWIYD